jgi:hypothetical protein
LGLPAHEPPGSDSAGLSPIHLCGAREKYSCPLENVHTPCTVFPQHQFSPIPREFPEFVGTKRGFSFFFRHERVAFAAKLACEKLAPKK